MRPSILKTMGAAALLCSMASGVSANPITRGYCQDVLCSSAGGQLTFQQTLPSTLTIAIDNTSVGSGGGYSAAITGFQFDIEATILAASVVSFKAGGASGAGTGADITGWSIAFDVNNNSTPGNTRVDVAYDTTNGINNGIYNFDDPGTNLNNLVRDVAILTLTVTNPSAGNWGAMTTIKNDILRMQRVGANGEGSLKLPGYDPDDPDIDPPPPLIPIPGTLLLLGLGIAALGATRRPRRTTS